MSNEPTALGLGREFALLASLWRVNHALERTSRALELQHGVSSLQRWVVRAIGKYPGITPGQLAEIFFLDAGSVTFALNSLEKKKLIERRRASKDKRRITLGLTARGRTLDGRLALGVEVACLGLLRQPDTQVQELQRLLDALASQLLARREA